MTKYKIVPIEAEGDWLSELIELGYSGLSPIDYYHAAIEAAPTTNLVAVDKGELDGLLGAVKSLIKLDDNLNFYACDSIVVESVNLSDTDEFNALIAALTPFGGENV